MNHANNTQNNHGLVPAPLVRVSVCFGGCTPSVFMMVGSKEAGGGGIAIVGRGNKATVRALERRGRLCF